MEDFMLNEKTPFFCPMDCGIRKLSMFCMNICDDRAQYGIEGSIGANDPRRETGVLENVSVSEPRKTSPIYPDNESLHIDLL
jgi:hypothetical protein